MERLTSVEVCVDRVIAKLGAQIRMAIPLALGKPNHFVNALYQRAKADPSIKLEIYTALTLERPKGESELEKRFLEPMVERLFGNYPDLDYELDRVSGTLPANVRILEFYFPAGKFLDNPRAQQDYISTNYTYVARDLMDRGVNLVAQQVAVEERGGSKRVSLSCNPDVSIDLLTAFKELAGSGIPRVSVAQRNDELPFMYGEADLPVDSFDFLIDAPSLSYTLFGPPKTSVSDADSMIGIYASSLVKDGGELQVGIGSLSDALVYALLLRHQHNSQYLDALVRFATYQRFGETINDIGETGTFGEGLFVASEMLVDGFMHLVDADIIKRRVYDDLPLQRLLNEQLISERVTIGTLSLLRKRRAVGDVLNEDDVRYLKRFGILAHQVAFQDGQLIEPNGSAFVPDLRDPQVLERIERTCLGSRLRGGVIMHGGFFLGSPRFYTWLRELPEDKRRLISMRSVQRVNQLYGHETLDRLHRRNARFFNTGMMVTLLGAMVSDALEDGRVVSGVGGQYNFVAMAHALPDGRSVLQLRSTRTEAGHVRSNVVWNYGHVTIPRHQRDILITEYGIARLRGRSDSEVIAELLSVTDSRFQDDLLAQAKRHGKIADDYRIPEIYRNNLPQSYQQPLADLRKQGLFPRLPFGTELTEEEVVLGRALKRIRDKVASTPGALEAVLEAAVDGAVDERVLPYLRRMGLDRPQSLRETLYQRLLATELRHALE